MNVEPLLKWGLDKLCLLENPDTFLCLECSQEYITEKLGWLTNFWSDLEKWKELIHIVKEAGKDERLLGTSEIIESVFGKMKRLEHDQAKSGFTVFILSLAAIVSKTTTEVVHKALETIPTKGIHKWFKKNIGPSKKGPSQLFDQGKGTEPSI